MVTGQTVHQHIHVRHPFSQQQRDLLRTAQAEGGYENPAAGIQHFPGLADEVVTFLAAITVGTVAVGCLDDQEIRTPGQAWRDLRRPDR